MWLLKRKKQTFESTCAFDDFGSAAVAMHIDLQNDGYRRRFLIAATISFVLVVALLLMLRDKTERGRERERERESKSNPLLNLEREKTKSDNKNRRFLIARFE